MLIKVISSILLKHIITFIDVKAVLVCVIYDSFSYCFLYYVFEYNFYLVLSWHNYYDLMDMVWVKTPELGQNSWVKLVEFICLSSSFAARFCAVPNSWSPLISDQRVTVKIETLCYFNRMC